MRNPSQSTLSKPSIWCTRRFRQGTRDRIFVRESFELLNEPFRSQIFLCTRTNLISRCWLVESLVVSVRPTPSVRVELSNYVKSISIDPGSPLSRSNSPNPPNSGFSGICHSVSVFPNPSHLGKGQRAEANLPGHTLATHN